MKQTVTHRLAFMLCFALSGIVYAQQQTDTLSLFFDIDKFVIEDNNAKLLNKLATDKNIISVSIYGYTDFLGSKAYNQQLSERRSASVRNYLTNKGINKGIITLSQGEGIYPNSAEENRRDLSDKGIRAHRTVRVVYNTINSQVVVVVKEVLLEENLLEEDLPEEKLPEENLSEENLVVGNNIVLENLFFYNMSDEFRTESYPTLRALLETMQKHPTLKIEIQGHICCQENGIEVYTQDGKAISVIRARAVYNYLIKNGIKSTRMTYKGYASTRKRYPLEQNEYERDMNRRVEILILKK
jgi:outer membrane protein OmpA-like peptidoglycan-associated protein